MARKKKGCVAFVASPNKATGSHHHHIIIIITIVRKKGDLQEDTICWDCAKVWQYDGDDGYVMASEQAEKVL